MNTPNQHTTGACGIDYAHSAEDHREWFSLGRGEYVLKGNRDDQGTVGQVRRTGSRFKGLGWAWWAYGIGIGEASTMESAKAAVERAVETDVVR